MGSLSKGKAHRFEIKVTIHIRLTYDHYVFDANAVLIFKVKAGFIGYDHARQ